MLSNYLKILDVDVVYEAEIHDVDRYLWVVDILQCLQDLVAGHRRWLRSTISCSFSLWR